MSKLLNILATLTLFGGSIWVILARYETERTVGVEKGLGPVPSAMIVLIGLIGISFVLKNFSGKIYQDPFGAFAIRLYALMLAFITGAGYMLIKSFSEAAEQNVERFSEDLMYHATTFLYVMFVGLIAIALSFGVPLFRAIKRLK